MEVNKRAVFILISIFIIIASFGFIIFNKIDTARKIAEQEFLDNQRIIEETNKTKIELQPEDIEIPFLINNPSAMKIDITKKINEPYIIHRNNVSMAQDLNVSIKVYNFKLLNNFTYYDYNWGTDFEQIADPDYQYLFIFVRTEMDNILTGDDVRMPLISQKQFTVQIKDMLYNPITFNYEQYQIREFEKMFDFKSITPKPYGYEYVYMPDENEKVARVKHWEVLEKYWLIGGSSNAEDGFIVYYIPKNIPIGTIRVNGNFWSFGSASWQLYD